MPEWVVLLEAADDAGHGPINGDDLEGLHQALHPGPYGGCLHSSDRYALQVTTTGAGPLEALLDVVARWFDAVRDLQLPGWKLLRIEVFTPEDLKREWEDAQRQEIPVRVLEPGAGGQERDDDVGTELVRQAFSDPLTGLLGREAFAHQVDAAVVETGAGGPLAVVCLDIDGFHGINQRFGGAGGDHILVTVAGRLAAKLRRGDVLARLGGDEYGVLLSDTTEERALGVAERMLDAVRLPVTISGHELILSASAGVAVSLRGDSGGVVGNAWAALRAAQAAGGGGSVLYGADVPHQDETGSDFATAALQDRLAHLHLMQQAAVAANEADTLEQAAHVVMRQICTHVGCALGHLWVPPAPGSAEMAPTLLWHIPDGKHPAVHESTEPVLAGSLVGLTGRVLGSGRPAWISDLAENKAVPSRTQATSAALQSAFAFPVVVGSEVVAVLSFFSGTHIEPTGSFNDVVAGIGTQLGRVVERQRAAAALQRSAEQLRASERRLRDAQHLAGVGSWHHDLHGCESSW